MLIKYILTCMYMYANKIHTDMHVCIMICYNTTLHQYVMQYPSDSWTETIVVPSIDIIKALCFLPNVPTYNTLSV